ncbi:hypothetical protein N7492_004259 [Penicillium capsulatum]|uniref:Uncharacterized protein n=1 Tax=Penicillium capsulatum TaxID=69766 RepID=A0A9W9I7I9_9EURO|nr:hypothetical protein N7492_004259 [Penicillium capsulatum]KAJ6136621.1 hypothetical protein N7512_001781 [Penicillium capsulatum]
MSFASFPLATWAGGASVPTATITSTPSFSPAVGEVEPFLQVRNIESSFSSFPTAWEIKPSLQARAPDGGSPTSSTNGVGQSPKATSTVSPTITTGTAGSSKTQDADPTLATQANVGVDPDICTSYMTTFRTQMSVPTGIVRFKAIGPAQWGNIGTIWNFTTGAGARLTDMKAACQGSGCTGINGDANRQGDGLMKQRPDGSWFLKVDRHMQPSLMVSGQLVTDKASTAKRKYPLDVSTRVQCGRMEAKNCTDGTSFINTNQWEAYRVDQHIGEYMWGARSINGWGESIMRKTMSTTDAKNQKCIIGNDAFNCDAPDTEDCARDSSADHVRALMLRASYVNLVDFMNMVYHAVTDVKTTIGTQIDSIVTNVWKAAAERTWTGAAAVASSVIGLVIVAAVVFQFIVAPEATPLAIAALAAVAGTIAGSNVAGLSGNVANYVDTDPAAPDAQTKKSTQYTLDAYQHINETQKALVDAMASSSTGTDGIKDTFKGATWISDKAHNVSRDSEVRSTVSEWYKRMLVGEYVGRAMKDYDRYILWIKYGKDVKWFKKKQGLSKEDCEKHWVGNTNWKYTAVCDVPYGPDGDLGMAVLTGPMGPKTSPTQTQTKPLFDDDSKVKNGKHKLTGRDIIASAMHGQYLHGFNFTLSSTDWAKQLKDKGPSALQERISRQDPDEPGLYSLPVCEITNLVYLPQSNLAMNDWKGLGGKDYLPIAKGPCSCRDYTWKDGSFVAAIGMNSKIQDTIMDCGVEPGLMQKDYWRYGDGGL